MGDIHACIQKSKSQITHCHGFRVEYVYSEGICLGYEAQAWKCSGENSDEMGHGWSLFHVDVCCLFMFDCVCGRENFVVLYKHVSFLKDISVPHA